MEMCGHLDGISDRISVCDTGTGRPTENDTRVITHLSAAVVKR